MVFPRVPSPVPVELGIPPVSPGRMLDIPGILGIPEEPGILGRVPVEDVKSTGEGKFGSGVTPVGVWALPQGLPVVSIGAFGDDGIDGDDGTDGESPPGR